MSDKDESGSGYLASDSEEDDDVPMDERITHTQNPKIYIRRVKRSWTDQQGLEKKSNRVFNLQHLCPFCPKKVINFGQHVLGMLHDNEPEIIEIKKLDRRIPAEDKKRKKQLEILRYRVANEHNKKIIQKGKGEILLARREHGDDEEFDLNNYGPCPECLGWFKLKAMFRHQATCAGHTGRGQSKSSGVLLTESAILSGRVSGEASSAMIKEVFPKMKMDDIGKIAQNDHLIICLGNMWLQRNIGNQIMRCYYTSSIMRLMSKFLKNLRKLHESNEDLWFYIKPEFFKLAVQATLQCCSDQLDELTDEETLPSPSNAIKLGFDLKIVASAKIAESIIKKDKKGREDAKDFMDLMEISWSLKVTKLARVTLDNRRMNNKPQLPEPGQSGIYELTRGIVTSVDHKRVKK